MGAGKEEPTGAALTNAPRGSCTLSRAFSARLRVRLLAPRSAFRARRLPLHPEEHLLRLEKLFGVRPLEDGEGGEQSGLTGRWASPP